MLRNVLEDYLSFLVERDLDYPILALLQAMGFYDIHFTHGAVEFGKDFIAKRVESGIEYQYAIQSKNGDINQELWRNKIRGQLEEAIVTNLSHPQFNANLPRKAVLATTGRLVGNARLASQEFKAKLILEGKMSDLEFWEKEQLSQFSEEFGFTAFHITVKELTGLGQFYLTYSKAIQGILSDREIEEFSRLWIDETLDSHARVFRASIEAEIIVAKLLETGRYYESIITYLSLARLVMLMTYEIDEAFITNILNNITERIRGLCAAFLDELSSQWQSAERDFLRVCGPGSSCPMLNYPVWCARVVEIGGLYFFLSSNESEREKTITFLIDFINLEQGVGHIPGDRYSVSLVWTTLALLKCGKTDHAIQLLKKALIWLCDRMEKGWGLAEYDASETEETAILLSYPFDFINRKRKCSSYLATVITDLAAFIGDKEFYGDCFNDIEACEFGYTYWQFPDTKAVFSIDTEEVLTYANIPHEEVLTRFEDLSYAEHIRNEPNDFRITEKAGMKSLVMLSVLLKDRYFPRQWSSILFNQT
jgi:hypothetical protein